ncbi:MAG: hypothetical protein J6D28_01380 [Bacilli bacterium]|nr:hypothetical protein [Bacilli bacterium]
MAVSQIKEQKRFFPLKEGYFLPITNDRIFKIFCKDENNRKFLAKVINLVTGIDYNLLVDKMIIVDSVILEDREDSGYNDEDILISISGTSIDIDISDDMSTNKNKTKTQKYDGNQHKIGEKNKETVYNFYQIFFETYRKFDNDLLINEVKPVNVSSGNFEVENNGFIRFHVNLSDIDGVCFNNAKEKKYYKFFTLEKIEDLKQISKEDEILMEAFKCLEKINNNSILMSLLEELELEEFYERAAIDELKQINFDKGKTVGLIDGKKQEKIEIARNMLNKNFDLNIIASITSLTKEELENLN